jgi:tetratricopeptide (TPR) repeat protein
LKINPDKMLKTLFIFLFIIFITNSYGQVNIDSLSQKLEVTKLDTSRLQILKLLSKEIVESDPQKALVYAEEGLEISKKLNNPSDMAAIYLLLGVISHYEGNYDLALEYYNESLSICESIKDSLGIAKGLHNIGVVSKVKGDYDKSLEFYFKALTINEGLRDGEGIAKTLSVIANVYNEQKNYDLALKYYFRAMEQDKKRKDELGMAYSFNNIGTIHTKKKDYQKALKYYAKSIELYEKLKNKYGTSLVYINVGIVYKNLEDYTQALVYAQKSLTLKKELGDKRGISVSLNSLGNIYTRLENYPKAIEAFSESMSISKELGLKSGIKYSSENLSIAYAKQGMYKKAFEFHILFSQMQDSLLNEKITSQMAEMAAKYETIKNEKEIILQNNEIESLKRDKEIDKLRQYILSGGVILLLAIGALVYNYQRTKMKTAQLEEQHLRNELAYKGKKLVDFALHIVEKNDFLQNLKNEIQLLNQSLDKKENIREVDRIASRLDQNLRLDKEREELNMYVEEANQIFFHKLQQRFPSLTDNDIRLCALLRLDFSSKEISTLFNIEAKSVDMSRYRLRKKLDLQPDASLMGFLNNV